MTSRGPKEFHGARLEGDRPHRQVGKPPGVNDDSPERRERVAGLEHIEAGWARGRRAGDGPISPRANRSTEARKPYRYERGQERERKR